jgi:protein-S-isoprenylcysteine O-methyltransferase Ste14
MTTSVSATQAVQWIVRHLIALAVLPVSIAALIPLWLADRDRMTLSVGSSVTDLLLQACGLVALSLGLTLFLASLWWFVSQGRGTLAPWDPPRHLVVQGPYRYVRNPMISGVVMVLFGEAGVLLSIPHLAWASIVLGINTVYIPLIEEPSLRERFEEEYRVYCQHVPRLFPRLRPWEPAGQA